MVRDEEAGETRRYLLPRALNYSLINIVFMFKDDPVSLLGKSGEKRGWEHHLAISLQ